MTSSSNHAPANYICPICLALQGIENDNTMMRQDDIFFRDDLVVAAISSKFIDSNPGHAIIFPIQHCENLYDLPSNIGHRIIDVSQKVAHAMRSVRQCDGITILQNNEPAGGQHAFHYHMHIFPRFEGDNLHTHIQNTRVSTPAERKPYADGVREYLSHNS